MHIESIHIERSGSLADVTIDRLGPGVQVLHGTNETGKTSLLEFVRAMFFGFEGLFRRGVLDPRQPCSGRLVVGTGEDGRRLAIERRHEGPELATLTQASYEDDIVGLGGDSGDFVSVTDVAAPADGLPWNRPYLQDVVGEIDERTFTNVMAFGLDELHELRTLEPEGCGSRLYELASGLDRSKVSRVLAHIRQAIERLDSSDPAMSPIESLRLRRHEVLDRLAGFRTPALAAGHQLAELARIDTEIAHLEESIARAVDTENVVRRVLPIEPLYRAWRETAGRLHDLVGARLVHPDLDAWKRASRTHRKLARLARRRQRTRVRLARSLADVPAESAVWKQRAAVTALCEEQPRLERIEAEVSRAEAHARLAARRLGEQIGAAGLSRIVAVSGGLDSVDVLPDAVLPEGFLRSFGPLRSRARECAAASRDVAAARRGVTEAKDALEGTRGLVGGGAGVRGMTIAEAIEEATGRATAYRNRLAAAEQLAELDRSITRLDHEVAQHLQGQLLPLSWLIPLGAVFVTGAGMLLSGLLLPSTVTGPLAYALAALGLAGTGVASVTTWTLDRSASTRLDAARAQRAMVHRQREELLAHCVQLDRKIPTDAANPLDRRLAAVQVEIDRLEELAAREGSMHQLSDRVAVAEQALKQALSRRKEARRRWQRGLQSRGLPTTLSPREVKQIGLHRHTLMTLDDDRRRLSEEARQRREELAAFAKRIDELMIACELVPESTPLDHARQLRERLEAEVLSHRRRNTLTRRLERARAAHRRAKRQLRAAEHQVQDSFKRWGVATEKDFLAKVDRRPLFERTKLEAEEAETAWLEARHRVTEPAELDEWLAEPVAATAPSATPLEQRLSRACEATARLRASVDVVRSHRERVATAVEASALDRCTEPLQAELADVEHQLAAQLDRRRLLERTGLLLEETRLAVARDHQPPVLREASHWLGRLTEGRYVSITTTIDEPRLEVHERDGTVWKPERLSRGTREQVFLALRLALVRDLQRHGVQLPIVMDDALVNFDDERARAAARVLVDFVSDQPGRRQMLVFTCHAHIADIFAATDATVRSLSDPQRDWKRPTAVVPVAATPAPAPTSPPVQPPQPETPASGPAEVLEYDAGPHAWPAEEFFFSPTGGYAAARRGHDQGGRRPEASRTAASPQPRRSRRRSR